MLVTDEELEYEQDHAEAALDELGQIAPGISIPTSIDQLINIIQRQQHTIEKMTEAHIKLQTLFSDHMGKRE